MKFIRITLFVLGILSLANVALIFNVFDSIMIFALQISLSLFIIAYAIFFNKIPKKIHIASGILCLFPIAILLLLATYGNTTNVTYREDVVIVLGAGVVGENVTRPLARRLDAAFEYWQQNPTAYIITTGGLGERATITEAEAMARYLVRLGIPRERILLEEHSTSTYENLKFTKTILDEHFPDDFSVVLITNDFHLYRSVQTARSVGLYVNRKGAYTDWYSWPVNYLREMIAVVHMWIF